MDLFVIDQQRCECCGSCVAVCPLGMIKMAGPRAFPEPAAKNAAHCINCGHCVSICPHGAFSLATMPSEQCEKIRWDLMPALENVETMIRARRAIRNYKAEAVPAEVVTRLIDTARYAPTGKNVQLLNWLVIQSRDQLDGLITHVIDWMKDMIVNQHHMAEAFGLAGVVEARQAGKDPILRGAPALVLVYAPVNYRGGAVDATIALTTFELAAFAAGLGTCWAGFFQIAAAMWAPLHKALALPEGQAACGAMMLGYPRLRYKRVPQRHKANITWR